jgi:hypothetical protein
MTLLKIQLKVMQFPNALLWNSEQTPHTQLSLEFAEQLVQPQHAEVRRCTGFG